jgi:hypothetical protein
MYSTEARALPSAVNGSVACRPPPGPLTGGYSNSPDLNATSRSCARALHDSASVAARHLTYELLRNLKISASSANVFNDELIVYPANEYGEPPE